MSQIIQFLPGFVAAVAAFIAAKVLRILPIGSLTLEVITFVVTYAVVVYIADRAMRGYGRNQN